MKTLDEISRIFLAHLIYNKYICLIEIHEHYVSYYGNISYVLSKYVSYVVTYRVAHKSLYVLPKNAMYETLKCFKKYDFENFVEFPNYTRNA